MKANKRALLLVFAALEVALSQDLILNNTKDFLDFFNSSNYYQNGLTVILNADIDLSGCPIGPLKSWHDPVFDGRGHTISGVSMTTSEASVGLFSDMFRGSIKNLVLDDTCSIVSTYSNNNSDCSIGGFFGYSSANNDIFTENCVNMASLSFRGCTKYLNMGGIIGSSKQTGTFLNHIKNCVNKGQITYEGSSKYADIGGIAGFFGLSPPEAAVIVSCENYGVIKFNGVTNWLEIGGIIGGGSNVVTLSKCKNFGSISTEGSTVDSSVYIGGIMGQSMRSNYPGPVTIKNCENYGGLIESSSSGNSYVGGIIGECFPNNKTYPCIIYNSVNRGNLYYNKGNSKVGGIVGNSNGRNDIENCMNLGNISSADTKNSSSSLYIGGISGYGDVSSIKNCANYGSIETDNGARQTDVGNIFGECYSECKVINCLGAGMVHQRESLGSLYYGGMIGYGLNNIIIDNCVTASDAFNCTSKICTVGRVTGYSSQMQISNCFWKDALTGGATGKNYGSTISDSYSYNVEGDDITTSTGASLIDTLNNRSSAATELGYAEWAQNTGESTVKFVVNGKEVMLTNNHVILIPSFVTTTNGNESFEGWFTDDLMSNHAGTVTEITADTTFYGAFGMLRTITFVYGSNTVKSTQAEGEDLVLPTHTEPKAGYTFNGWMPDVTIVGYKVPPSDFVFTANLTANNYTVTFKNGYDESDTTIKTLKCDETITFPTFTRDGYNFSGWSSDVPVTDNKMPAGNVVFTAQWTEVPSENITNIVQVVFKKASMSKEEMIVEIKASIDANEGTYKIKEITPNGSDDVVFIVVFEDTEAAKGFMRTIK